MSDIISKSYSLLDGNKKPLLNDLGLLLLRVVVGLTMLPHGWSKLINFAEKAPEFVALPGMSPELSLAMATTAQILASLGLIAGLFSRLSAGALFFTMSVVMYMQVFVWSGSGIELVSLYLAGYGLLLLTGPGRFSFDRIIFNKFSKR